jgi:hypothetical protein
VKRTPVFFPLETIVISRPPLAEMIAPLLAFGLGLPCLRLQAEDLTPVSGLAEVAQLARTGAVQLALRDLDRRQPAFDQDPVAWMVWERERIYLLGAQGRSDAVVERLHRLPESVTPAFRTWARTELAEALLREGRMTEALTVLRRLLWGEQGQTNPEDHARWRRMVIRAYLAQDRLDDARTALVRYRQDFGDGGREWRHLQAVVLLRSDRPGEVALLLEQVENESEQAYRALADLRARARSAEAVYQQMVETAKGEGLDPATRGLSWAVAAEAAAQLDGPRRIQALERTLSLPLAEELEGPLFGLSPEDLWTAYLAYGQALGNQEQRLLGQDEDWYFPATEALEKDPLRARVLFAVLAVHGTDPKRRDLAHEYLVSLLERLPDGDRLVRRLYLGAERFRQVEGLPLVVRYRLVDEALGEGDLATAGRLMRDLEAPPQGTEAFQWNLRRARVAIHSGRAQQGVGLLQDTLAAHPDLTEPELDRFLQVVFDLQTVQADEGALGLLEALSRREWPGQRQRELLFWQADSVRALDRPADAAYLYLKSAILLDPTAMDPWAETARYRAAQALAEAGLLQDARRLYASLLRSTRDEGRQARLRNELQRLQLRAKTKEPSS